NAVFIYSQPSSARAGASQASLTEVHVYPGSTTAATSVPVAVREAETTSASATTKTRLTAEATKDLLGDRSRVSQKRAATTLGQTYGAKHVGPLAQVLARDGEAAVPMRLAQGRGQPRR